MWEWVAFYVFLSAMLFSCVAWTVAVYWIFTDEENAP